MSTLSNIDRLLDDTTRNSQPRSFIVEVLRMLTSREGGLEDLRQSFERNGLAHVISSWIGTGNNAPISSDQIRAALGTEHIAVLAKKVGISSDAATQQLTTALPNLVNALTPNGRVGGPADLSSQGRDLMAALAARDHG